MSTLFVLSEVRGVVVVIFSLHKQKREEEKNAQAVRADAQPRTDEEGCGCSDAVMVIL